MRTPPRKPRGHSRSNLPRLDSRILRLVAVTGDPGGDDDRWFARIAAAVSGGATAVQLRAKRTDSRTMLALARRLVRELPVPVFVNDRADIALLAGAAGVHLGSDDVPVAAVRAVVPDTFIIGASLGTDAELENALGADYVGIGPVFASPSKPDAGKALGASGLARLAKLTAAPVVAIGGITSENVGKVMGADADNLAGVAVVSALAGAPNSGIAARALRDAIERSGRAFP